MDYIEFLKAVVFGIIQGITEWLPISSTGHLILSNEFLQLKGNEDFVSLFMVVVQMGSVLAVFLLFLYKLNPFALSKNAEEKKKTWLLWFKVIIGALPAGIVGILLDDYVDKFLYTPIVIGTMLIIYGVIFILTDRMQKNRREALVDDVGKMSNGKTVQVGLFQIAALIPGVSRSGSTIVGGLLMGMTRTAAAEFSFFMSLPLIVGASGMKALKYILEGLSFTTQEILVMAVGTVVSFVVSLLVVRWLMRYLAKHGFTGFGIYRIILGAVVLVYFLLIAK